MTAATKKRPAAATIKIADRMVGEAQVRAESFNESDRTVEVVWAAGSPVKRYSWDEGYYMEELSMEPKHIRLDRFKSGDMSLLDSHDSWSMEHRLGTVIGSSVRIEGGKGYATVKLSRANPLGEQLFQDLRDGHCFPVSVGYKTHAYERREGDEKSLPVLRAVDWEPMELSAVPVPADPAAHSLRGDENDDHAVLVPIITPKTRTATMPKNALSGVEPAEDEIDQEAEERKIRAYGERIDEDPRWIERQIKRGKTFEEIKDLSVDRRIDKRQAQPSSSGHANFGLSDEDPQVKIRAMGEVLFRRAVPGPLSDEARAYAGMSELDVARECLRGTGDRMTGQSGPQIITRAMHTSSDFALVMGAGVTMGVLEGYKAVPAALKTIARKSTAPDFRAKTSLRMSEAADLEKVNEAGEFKHGTILETGNSYKIATYGKMFSLSRQLLINGDAIGAFADMPVKFGRATARLEADLLVRLLEANSVMGNGHALFSVAHKNLAPSGTALSATSLAAARLAMRKQKDTAGALIDVVPRYLVVPAELEDTARALVETNLSPITPEDVNANAGRVKVVVEARLTSATAWYLAADPNITPALEYAFLEGAEEPLIESRPGWNIDGLEWKVRHDFGAGAIDYVGLYKNAGA